MSWQVINEQPSLVQDRSGLVWTTPIVNQAQSIVQYNLTRLKWGIKLITLELYKYFKNEKSKWINILDSSRKSI
jgi:hypothetical protein